jgi:hypothetical protein
VFSRTPPQLGKLPLRDLGQGVRDLEPGALGLDKDMLVWAEHRIVVKKARRNLEPGCSGGGIWNRRTASRAECHSVGRRTLSKGRFVPSNEFGAGEQSEVANFHAQAGYECRAGGFAATLAVAELKGADCAVDFELHAATEATASDHVRFSAAPPNGSAFSGQQQR